MDEISQEARWKSFAAASVFLILMGIVEYLIFFRGIHHFFQGDSLFWLYHRPVSIGDFLKGFLTTDASGRYRPLGNRLLPFLLYPCFGLATAGYRIVSFIVFFAIIVAVFALIRQLTKSWVATVVATLFFATHTVAAYASYDVAFVTELMWALFYVCSVIAYVRHIRTNHQFFLAISVLCFVGSLWSKETAVTLPATLVAVDLFMSDSGSVTRRILNAAVKVRWHALVLLIYVVFVFGYLKVYDGAIGTKPPDQNQGGYYFALNARVILANVDQAMTWAFNIPRGWHTQWRDVPKWSLTFLKGLRLAIAVLALILLFDLRGRWLFIGLAWFLIVLIPAFPLRDHFIPYYLFLPLVGFSLVIGAAVDWLYQYLNRHSRAAAFVICFAPSAILVFICAKSIRSDVKNNVLLGASAKVALNSLNDIKGQFPELKPDTTLYIINAQPDLPWIQGEGGLFKLYYKEALKRVLYSSEDSGFPTGESGSLIVLKYDKETFRDVTAPVLANPDRFAAYVGHYVDGPNVLKLNPTEVVAGSGSYTLTIEGLANTDATIHYVLNGGPVETFTIHLDAQGQSQFDVASNTPKGLYRFIGFNLPGAMQSSRSDATMIVR